MAAETVDDGADLGLQPLQLGGSGVAVGGMDSDDDVDDAEAAAVATERPNLKQLIDSGAEAWGHADASDVLRQLLPPRKPPPTDADLMLDGHETQEAIDAKLRELQAALVQRVRRRRPPEAAARSRMGLAAAEAAAGGTAAAWEDLGLSSAHFRGCVGALRLADSEYLELVKRLNVNSRSSETQRVMVRHPECEQPVLFVVPQVSVQPGPPEVRERLQANRQRFIGVHSTMQELSRQFAAASALLDALCASMHLSVPRGAATADAAAAAAAAAASAAIPSHAQRAGGIELFFLLLPVALGYSLPASVGELCGSFTALIASIGAQFVQGHASLQHRLLRALLAGRAVETPEALPLDVATMPAAGAARPAASQPAPPAAARQASEGEPDWPLRRRARRAHPAAARRRRHRRRNFRRAGGDR